MQLVLVTLGFVQSMLMLRLGVHRYLQVLCELPLWGDVDTAHSADLAPVLPAWILPHGAQPPGMYSTPTHSQRKDGSIPLQHLYADAGALGSMTVGFFPLC